MLFKPHWMLRTGRYLISGSYHGTLLNQTKAVAPFLIHSKFLSSQPETVIPIPEPPFPPVHEDILNALGEPTLSSLGLCSYWPSGWYQSALEWLHVTVDLPWWGAITATTICIRLFLFPFLINQRRSLARYTKAMPHLAVLQDRLTSARLSGDYVEAMRVSKELQDFLKVNDVNPLKSMKLLIVQVPIFLSVFAGLRGMAALPVPSMQTGGMAWFTDLTIPDPYFLLPLMSMGSIMLMFETGTELSAQQVTPTMKLFMRLFPLIGFFMVINMPSALLWYWTMSNTISLIQSFILRVPAIRDRLKLPKPCPPPPSVANKRGFVTGFKESMHNSRLLAELESRERLDAQAWQKSGRGAVPRTFASRAQLERAMRIPGTVVETTKEEDMKRSNAARR